MSRRRATATHRVVKRDDDDDDSGGEKIGGDGNDEKEALRAGGFRWVDGECCCLKTCATAIDPEEDAVVLATDERKRRLLRKSPTLISWVASGRQVMHRSCHDQLVLQLKTPNKRGKKQPRPAAANVMGTAERALFRAAQGTAEYYSSASAVKEAAIQAARLLWSVSAADHEQQDKAPPLVVFTGAGISASAGIPTYRGTNGLRTKERLEHVSDDAEEDTDFCQLQPTATHRHLVTLEQQGWLSYTASQNCDNLHGKAGTDRQCLTELHGNLFVEYCSQCGKEYERPYAVDEYSTDCYKEPYYVKCRDCGFGHFTGRHCTDCGGKLQDTIVNFGDALFSKVLGGLERACQQFRQASLCLALGSSLSVTPANLLVSLPKHRIIVNLQATDLDETADIRVWTESDAFMQLFLAELVKGRPSEVDLALPSSENTDPVREDNWQELQDCIEYSRKKEASRRAQMNPQPGKRKRKRTLVS